MSQEVVEVLHADAVGHRRLSLATPHDPHPTVPPARDGGAAPLPCPFIRPHVHAETPSRLDGRAPCLRGPFLVTVAAAAFEHVGQRRQRDCVPRPTATGQLGHDGTLQMVDRAIDVSHRRCREAERPVSRPVAGDGDAGHHGQLGERRQQPVARGRRVRIVQQIRRLANGEHRCRPPARGSEPFETGIPQAGEGGPRSQLVAGRRGKDGPGGDERGQRLCHCRRVDQLIEQVQQLVAPSLEPPDRHQLRAVPAECIGVADVAPELVTGRRQAFGVFQPPLAGRQHDVDRGDHVGKGIARGGDEPVAQLRQRAAGPSISDQQQVDRSPRQPDQTIERAACGRRDRDQLLGQHRPLG